MLTVLKVMLIETSNLLTCQCELIFLFWKLGGKISCAFYPGYKVWNLETEWNPNKKKVLFL